MFSLGEHPGLQGLQKEACCILQSVLRKPAACILDGFASIKSVGSLLLGQFSLQVDIYYVPFQLALAHRFL